MATKSVPKNQISDEALARITRDIKDWHPGAYARKVAYGPACICGLRPNTKCFRHRWAHIFRQPDVMA